MNSKLDDIGESPLQMSGFVCLRLYTGPMYFKYNTVLRGVSVPGCKAPLEAMFMKLCQGNKYTNTLHCIAASINKLSRVSMATTVYRAPGGVLPKSFWESDRAGIKGGVEMGFMSTSRSKEAAMDYAKRSGIKLLFELQQGMVARGADVSWLSMYPNEDEVCKLMPCAPLLAPIYSRASIVCARVLLAQVLFAPLTACEVHQTRIEGSVLIVELRPGAAPASLMEKSVEEKEEEERISKEKAEAEAIERKEAIEEVAKTRAQWMSSMSGLKVSAEGAKRAQAELSAAQAELRASSEADRAEKAEAEQVASSKTLKAMRQMKEMEAEEREAASQKAAAQLAAKERLQKAKDMGEYIKKAALRERLREEQEALRGEIVKNQAEREKEEQTKNALAARAMVSATAALKLKSAAEADGSEIVTKLAEAAAREVELSEKLQQSVKRLMKAEQATQEAQYALKEANSEFKIEEIAEVQKLKDPLEMAEKLELWLSDPKTVPTASERVVHLCKKDAATNRKKFMSLGAIEKLVRAMQANPEDSVAQGACCAALAALSGAPGAGKRAAEAGALPVLVRAMNLVQRTPLKALFNITSTDAALVEAAKEAGAKDEWLFEASTGGDEQEDLESPNALKRQQTDKKNLKKEESKKQV